MSGQVQVAITEFGGDGPLLLLGPSLGTTARNLWGAVAERLVGAYRVVGWDLPGHGACPPSRNFDVSDLATAVLAAVDDSFSYAGASLGGAVGLQLLLDAPQRVDRAVLISTGARIGVAAAWKERAELVRREGTSPLATVARDRWFGPASHATAAADMLLRDLAEADPVSYAAACEALARFDVRSRLAEIVRPVLAIGGALDPVTSPATLRHIATGVQFGGAVILDGTSHQLVVEAPDEVASLIVAHADAQEESPTVAAIRARGMRTRREVLGDDYVDRAASSADDMTSDFQELITRYAWNDVWSRPGLDRRTRSMLTIALLATLGHERELAMHVRAARRNGVTDAEIVEVMLQVAIYAGVPVANSALLLARAAIAEPEGHA